MLDFIESADDVIAVKFSHAIGGADLQSVMDRLEKLMASHDKVHVFVETQDIQQLELQGLASYIARAMPLFGKLDRFGRVAVVADQAWIRIGTRLESAILPFISYRVFPPADRDAALAWVDGRQAA
ncbi:MAG TPA: STAS/SEC14 domain-containing protein [Phenylobacterium sp.]